jgi:hypothetical protein
MYGGELPFTGSLFTLPLIVLGLILSLGGWVGGRLKQSRARR